MHHGSARDASAIAAETAALRFWFGGFAQDQGELGLAGGRGVVEGAGGAVRFAGFEEESALDAIGEAGEAGFAVGIGADFKIELADAGESVGDVDFDLGGIDRLGGGVVDGEIGRAGAQATVDDRDGVGVGSLRNSERDKEDWEQECFQSEVGHGKNYKVRRRGRTANHRGHGGAERKCVARHWDYWLWGYGLPTFIAGDGKGRI